MRRAACKALLLLLPGFLLASCAQPGTSPEAPPPPGGGAFDLSGTAWTLESLNAQPPLEGTTITLEFGDGTFRGQSGCNSYGGDYTASGASLEFADMTLTAMACEPPVMAQEEAYVYALIPAATYSVAEDRLELVNRDNAEALRFTLVRP